MSDKTHYDPVDSGSICHAACAVAEIARLREQLAAANKTIEAQRNRDLSLGQMAGKIERLEAKLAYEKKLHEHDCEQLEAMTKEREMLARRAHDLTDEVNDLMRDRDDAEKSTEAFRIKAGFGGVLDPD